jgi:hypothetical protein
MDFEFIRFPTTKSLVNDKMPTRSSPWQRNAELWKTAGVAVLVLGFVAAGIIYWSGEKSLTRASDDRQTSADETRWKDGSLSPEDLKGSSRTIEMNYGKVSVLIVNWLHRFEQLKPHQLLALLVATIATLVAVTCFFIASRLPGERL